MKTSKKQPLEKWRKPKKGLEEAKSVPSQKITEQYGNKRLTLALLYGIQDMEWALQ